jgi:hypothetical protein
VLLINRWTKEVLDLGSEMSSEERTVWLFRKRIKDFDRLVLGLGLSVSFLTVTQSDVSVESGFHWITALMQGMKKNFDRRGLWFFYVAALEIQPKRYRRYGVLASHWHIVIGYSLPGALPHGRRLENGHVEKVREGSVITWDWLFKNVKQKFGMYFCCDSWSRSVEDYLGKYLAKDELLKEFKARLGRRVRVFASSRFPVEFQMTGLQAIEFEQLVVDHPDLADLFWHRERSSIVGRGKEVCDRWAPDGSAVAVVRYPRVRVIRGEWIEFGVRRVFARRVN